MIPYADTSSNWKRIPVHSVQSDGFDLGYFAPTQASLSSLTGLVPVAHNERKVPCTEETTPRKGSLGQ